MSFHGVININIFFNVKLSANIGLDLGKYTLMKYL